MPSENSAHSGMIAYGPIQRIVAASGQSPNGR